MRFRFSFNGLAIGVFSVAIVVSLVLNFSNSKDFDLWSENSFSVKMQSIQLEILRYTLWLSPPTAKPELAPQVTLDNVQQAVRLGADWILSMQTQEGRFQYWYDPVQDKYSDKNDDNFLRQAGTAYALTKAYGTLGDEKYLQGARNSLKYLLQFRHDMPDYKSFFFENGKAKLGGIALPMLTLLELRKLTGETENDLLLHSLANMILFLQDQYETGQYKSTYIYDGDYEYEKRNNWESKIYPGEAMLALAEMYRQFKVEAYRNSIDRALKFYSDEAQWQYHAFLPWSISAFTSIYQQTRQEKYADFVYRMTDYLLREQNFLEDSVVYGSFHALPAANTGSYLEGLGDAVLLATIKNDTAKMEKWSAHAKIGYNWLLKLQYTQEQTQGLANATQALGGIRQGLDIPRQRIDNTQHALVAFCKGLEYVFLRAPVRQNKIKL